MKAVTFLLQLHEPVLAGQAQNGEANSTVASSFIPGSMIRGALFGRYTAGKAIDIEEDVTAHQLFLDGTVCYLNAYPTQPDTQIRALPKPLSWFVSKDDANKSEATIFDFAVEYRGGEPHKPPSSGDFVWQTRETVQLGSPAMVGIVHNTSDNPNRKSETDSQVYRYEAIAAEQWFAGVVLSEDEGLLARAKQLLEAGDMNLGGSHTAGYGRVSITDVLLEHDWWEFRPLSTNADEPYYEDEEDEYGVETAVSEPEYAILTCLSDLIWRDKHGQINAKLETPSGKEPQEAYFHLRRVGGFNRKWGLPLCQSWAVQAGSVFVFAPECYAELEEWVKKGVGERRAEGYGRVALNWYTQAEIAQSKLPDFTLAPPDVTLSAESQRIAQEMANRQLRALVDQALAASIQRLSHFQSLPKAAHLSRARLAARRAWHMKDLGQITKHFFTVKMDEKTGKEKVVSMLSPTAVKQWEKAKIAQQNFKNWILDEIKQVADFSSASDLQIHTLPKVAGVEADFSVMREETLARLIEGILRQAVKAAKARETGGQHE
ncbi:MAG: hypothetical protein KC449_06840 [Anaerolineales bacterium]|nr:hypothetical protein [Anaerolineales bacterium]